MRDNMSKMSAFNQELEKLAFQEVTLDAFYDEFQKLAEAEKQALHTPPGGFIQRPLAGLGGALRSGAGHLLETAGAVKGGFGEGVGNFDSAHARGTVDMLLGAGALGTAGLGGGIYGLSRKSTDAENRPKEAAGTEKTAWRAAKDLASPGAKILRDIVKPSAVGAGLGAGVGALAAGEGNRLEGAGFGAAGGLLGNLAAKGLVSGAASPVGKLLREGVEAGHVPEMVSNSAVLGALALPTAGSLAGGAGAGALLREKEAGIGELVAGLGGALRSGAKSFGRAAPNLMEAGAARALPSRLTNAAKGGFGQASANFAKGGVGAMKDLAVGGGALGAAGLGAASMARR